VGRSEAKTTRAVRTTVSLSKNYLRDQEGEENLTMSSVVQS
jgi:hypothetical protein